LTDNIQHVVSSTLCHERDSNSQLLWWQALISLVILNPTTIWLRPRWPLNIWN